MENKGCEYCETGLVIKDVEHDLHQDVHVFVDDDDNTFNVCIVNGDERIDDNLYIMTDINYCPMCGRKL